MRHAGVLGALLATAALMCAMPGLSRLPRQEGRVHEWLKPAQLRTLTVWLMPGDVGDRKLLGELCAAFEKENKGIRVFLRVASADEWQGENAVLPDVALFETGDIAMPEELFLPLTGLQEESGMHAGVQRAAALWFAPNVLSVPQEWLPKAEKTTPRPASLLAASTAAPPAETQTLFALADAPWEQLIYNGALDAPSGTGWQQLLADCPQALKSRLVSGLLSGGEPARHAARLESLAAHQARTAKGESLCAFIPSTAVSSRARYAALCRSKREAKAFLQFLLAHRSDALRYGLLAAEAGSAPDALTQALSGLYSAQGVLPNAFSHTRQELNSLCEDGFRRMEDPYLTIVRLR